MYNHIPPFPYPWESNRKGYKFPTATELARFFLQSSPLKHDSHLGIFHLPGGILLNAERDLSRYVLDEAEKLLREQASVYQATNPGEYPCQILSYTYLEGVLKAVRLLCPRESLQVTPYPHKKPAPPRQPQNS